MKKTLIAIAALAATAAFAQSTVTMSGSLDAGVASTSIKGNNGFGYIGNITSTSGFGLNVSNDLGSGMTAYAKIWSDVNPQSSYGGSSGANALSLANSENKIGLKGGFGDIAFGAISDIGLESHLAATSFGTAIGSGTGLTSQMNASGKARSDNTIAYNTPSMGGFSLGYVGRKQQTVGGAVVGGALPAGGQSSVSQLAARYNAGPINVILSRVSDDGLNVGGSKVAITNVAGNYTFGAATVYAGIQGRLSSGATASSADSTRSALTFGGKYVFGANTVMATIGRVSESNALNAANTKGSKNLGLGYEYALAKTTSFVARWDRSTDDIASFATTTGMPTGLTTVTGNNDRSRLGVGIRTAF
jgi:predicted porin